SHWECTLEVSSQWSVVSSGQSRDKRSEVGVESENMHEFATDNGRLTTDYQLRLGLLCIKGLREEAGRAIVRARSLKPFSSLDDLHHRVPELRKDELRKLAAVGALNFIKQEEGKV